MYQKLCAALLTLCIFASGCTSRNTDPPTSTVEIPLNSLTGESALQNQAAAPFGTSIDPIPSENGGHSPVPASGASDNPVIDPSDWRLVLVNSKNILPRDHGAPLSQIPTAQDGYRFDSRAIEDLNAMLNAINDAGLSYVVISPYRTFETSERNYNAKVQSLMDSGMTENAAKAEAAKWIAPPGQSEHNTGLAIDLVSKEYWNQYGELYHEFEQAALFAWFEEHAADYGFILRYPKDKQDITGITYEPWHYRYVGKEHAYAMNEQNLCLEEYLEQAS